jgi:hypothetical protein
VHSEFKGFRDFVETRAFTSKYKRESVKLEKCTGQGISRNAETDTELSESSKFRKLKG